MLRRASDRRSQADALNNLALARYQTGEYPAVTAYLTEALELFCDLGDRHGQANSLVYLGIVQQLTGRYSAAASSLTRALATSSSLGYRLGEANALMYLGLVRWPPDESTCAALGNAVQGEMGEEAFEAAFSEGAAMLLDDAVAWIGAERLESGPIGVP